MPADLYLIRHGQSAWNAEGRMQGHLDSPLTALGRAQARAMGRRIAGVAGRRIASPLGRAQETAQLVFDGQPFVTDPRLAEIDIGEFSGRLFPDLQAAHPAIFAPPRLGWYDRAPGGEGLSGLHARCAAFLASLDGPAIIVTHGVTLRMLRMLAMGWTMDRFEELKTEQGAIHVVSKGQHEIWQCPVDGAVRED